MVFHKTIKCVKMCVCWWNEEGFPGRGHLRSKKLKGQKTVDRSTGTQSLSECRCGKSYTEHVC